MLYPALLSLLTLAEDAPAKSGGGLGTMVVPMLLVLGIFYVLLIMPERKKAKARDLLLKDIKKGDKVMTTSGIIARVAAVSEDEMKLEIADGVRVRFSRQAIQLKIEATEAAEKPEPSTSPA